MGSMPPLLNFSADGDVRLGVLSKYSAEACESCARPAW
jgi:hypothetical protein